MPSVTTPRCQPPPLLQVSLSGRFTGVGYTFVLAGFLKIVTLGGLAASAPVDTARTAFGKASPYLMVPVGLGLCWVAKQVLVRAMHAVYSVVACGALNVQCMREGRRGWWSCLQQLQRVLSSSG